jgi:hypothetical protein
MRGVLVFMFIAACGTERLRDADVCQPGLAGCPCLDNGLCATGLTCSGGECVGVPGGDAERESGDAASSGCNPVSPSSYTASQTLAYSCAFGAVDLAIAVWQLSDAAGSLRASPLSSSTGPLAGAMTTCPSGSFDLTAVLPGGCCETYRLLGAFDGPDSWHATLTADFCEDASCGCAQGDGYSCSNLGIDPCTSQSFEVVAAR